MRLPPHRQPARCRLLGAVGAVHQAEAGAAPRRQAEEVRIPVIVKCETRGEKKIRQPSNTFSIQTKMPKRGSGEWSAGEGEGERGVDGRLHRETNGERESIYIRHKHCRQRTGLVLGGAPSVAAPESPSLSRVLPVLRQASPPSELSRVAPAAHQGRCHLW